MVFKKGIRKRIRVLLRCCGVLLVFFAVPIWLLMIAMIVESTGVRLLLLCWLGGTYSIAWRIENG